jgi:hypothetical protein
MAKQRAKGNGERGRRRGAGADRKRRKPRSPMVDCLSEIDALAGRSSGSPSSGLPEGSST